MPTMMRFAVLRPFQSQDRASTRTPTIASASAAGNTALYQALAAAKAANDRAAMINIARAHRIAEAVFAQGVGVLQTPVARLDGFLLSRPGATLQNIDAFVAPLFQQRIGNIDWRAWMAGPNGVAELARLHDALLSASVGTDGDAQARRRRPELLRAVRLFDLLARRARDDAMLAARNGLDAALRAFVLLPKELFPLPAAAPAADPAVALAREAERVGQVRDATIRAVALMDSLQTAREELQDLQARLVQPALEQQRRAQMQRIEDAHRPPSLVVRLFGRKGRRPDPALDQELLNLPTSQWTLTEEAAGQLTAQSRWALEEAGVDPRGDIRTATEQIDQRIASVASEFHSAAPKAASVRIGGNFVSTSILPAVQPTGMVRMRPTPGSPEVAVPADPPAAGAPAVPMGHGSVKPLGFAELMVVRERTTSYEDGELAHVENVLRGEHRKRTHTRTEERELTVSTATESVTESERDLQTTDRFELQATAEEELQSKISAEAGVEATYSGGMYEIKADAGFSYERASQEASRTATAVAHEVTDRTVSRMREAVREERIARTRELVVEKNLHEIDNSDDPDDHVVGVYRWVNAVHRAEMANYGRRLMFEFVVPEPAAFFVHAQANPTKEQASLEKPEPPVYVAPAYPFLGFLGLNVGDTEPRPLEPSDLNDANYLHWVSKYNVQDVTAPPPTFTRIGIAVSVKPPTSGNEVVSSAGDLTVPDGYTAKSASINPTFIQHSGGYVRVAVGQRNTEFWGGTRELTLNDEDGKIPITVCYYNIAALTLTVEVTCRRSKSKLEEWQLKTYAAITNAYNLLKSEYEERLAAAQIQAGVAIQGRNPLRNREIERLELKRAALSVITGQHFDLFDAMKEGPAPLRYPQMDLTEAAAEGKYMQFFEQAIEWPAMSYIMYPYFWGRKSRWIRQLHMEDPDPKFELFLRAGAARVLVPVRPGYEQAILNYVSTDAGEIWNGGDPPQVGDPLFVSVADAIREDQGNWRVPGVGTLAVQQNAAIVNGAGTAFTQENDENRDIAINGVVYRIRRVIAADQIELDRNYAGQDAAATPFELGLKFVGQPWEFTVPTPLIHLQEDADFPIDLEANL